MRKIKKIRANVKTESSKAVKVQQLANLDLSRFQETEKPQPRDATNFDRSSP